MYREVIEHPKSLPPEIKKHLDLTTVKIADAFGDCDVRGAKPTVGSQTSLPLASLDNRQLVERLSSPIAWQRVMASQLLIERSATEVANELIMVASTARKPETRILAHHLIHRLGKSK